MPHFEKRASWKDGNQLRADPAILSVNKQLYAEGTELLYRRNFVIDVNCGNQYFSSLFDPMWRGYGLTARFPFGRAKQLTLRLGIVWPEVGHLFNHMVYICGVLVNAASRLNNLRVELHANLSQWEFLHTCAPMRELDVPLHILEHCSPYSVFTLTSGPPNGMAKYAGFYLWPLTLLGSISSCEITLAGHLAKYPEPQKLARHYEEFVTDVANSSPDDLQWLQSRYWQLVSEKGQGQQRDFERLEHDIRLQRTVRGRGCPHTNRKKTYCKRPQPEASCEGCGRWYNWLLECLQCHERACKHCTSKRAGRFMEPNLGPLLSPDPAQMHRIKGWTRLQVAQ